MYSILGLFNKAVEIYIWIIFIRVILSWISPYSRNDFTNLVYSITEPFLSRCKVVIPMGRSYMDLSPVVAYFVLNLFRRLVNYIFVYLMF